MLEYKDRHKGENCALLLNGDSIRKFSPAEWDGPIIGTNHSWELSCSTYHVVIDWKQLRDMAIDKLSQGRPGHIFVGKAKDTPRARESLERKRQYYGGINTKIVEIPGWEGRHTPRFTADFTKPVWCPNVAVLGLELATWMGFSRVDVWGLDLFGPKFWTDKLPMQTGTAQIQARQLAFIMPELKKRGVTVFNRNAYSKCGAFQRPPKTEISHGCNAG